MTARAMPGVEAEKVRAQAAWSSLCAGSSMCALPQPVVLRLLVLCDVVSHWLVFAGVDEAGTH